MSRFGLRSAADGIKQLEEKPSRRKTYNPVSISMKRNPLPKDTKFVTNIKDENIIDDIKIEIDDVEKMSDATDGQPRNRNVTDGDDDDEDDDGALVEGDVDGNYAQPFASSFKDSLICSVPLERIHDVILKLNLTKSKVENNSGTNKQSGDRDAEDVDESLDNDEDEEDDTNNISKQSTSTIKNLCLYCDKKFASHKMQLKHVEKFHCLQQDRRCSGRNSQMQQAQTPRKRKPALGTQNFAGCSFCPKSKGQSNSVILPASDLSALFLHLADCHADKYFGCKMCVMRFQNISKLSKHMEVVHKSLAFAFDESSSKSKDNDTDSPVSNDKPLVGERSKLSLRRQHRSQKSLVAGASSSGSTSTTNTGPSTTSITPNTSVIGAEEPILSRLGLTQNRLPNNRKGVRLRREKLIPELLLKSEQNHQPTTNFSHTLNTSSALASSTCSPKMRGKAIKTASGFSGESSSDVIFRVPTRNDILSCVFDDNFYKEVVSNVRNNLLFHLDGKIMGNSLHSLDSSVMRHAIQPQIRSTLVRSPIVITSDSEIHAATSLAAITAFPTLLTAEQFGGDGNSSKIRRPHTKNSWKWKWDSVKKFKLVNEGGKIVKKMKHPMLGLRDLSKLDMWTQLTMRQKHELQTHQSNQSTDDDSWVTVDIPNDPSREEKQRLNDQLNMILDMRLLPHIILEQNEQAIIKLENDEFGIGPTEPVTEDSGDNFMAQTFADETFLSMLNLLPNADSKKSRMNIVLSGEWARPRCYLCMCCGAKFEKLKSLEEHKMFRHSQILSTHYEVVGRELLNGNLLRHLFLPKKALSRYANDMGSSNLIYTGAARRLFWHKNETLTREITNNEESSDSLQSMLNSCTTNSLSIKNSSSTEDCEVDTKIATATALGLMPTNTVVSPTHSIQSCSSSSSTSVPKSIMKVQNTTQPLSSLSMAHASGNSIYGGNGCSKCGRKCNGILDLYRHMLDCSGDYVWSLAKKRKYRYYCGSKKRRPCNKHSILELRKNKSALKPTVKTTTVSNDCTEEGTSTSVNFTKTKTSPRPRPSDAESIKKMLENLPPKRVCKKIFPAINKTKKNIKPKLLAKHKIFHSLRKTRVRQMSQAAKILSKTKSQLQKSKKIVTRSTTVPLLTAAKNKSQNKPKPIKTLSSRNAKGKTSEKLSSPINDEVVSSIKVEPTKASPVPTEPVIEEAEREKDGQLAANSNVPESTNKKNEANSMPAEKAIFNVAMSSSVFADASQSGMQCFLSSTPDNDQPDVSSKDVTNASNLGVVSSVDVERHPPANKNVKRSKRISDCIAMLTGKLEQKLKTEQKVSAPRTVAEHIPQSVKTNTTPVQLPLPTSALPPTIIPIAIPPAILPTSLAQPAISPALAPGVTNPPAHQKELLNPAINVSEDLKSNKTQSPKKTPKRKAISRRIVKTDDAVGIPIRATDRVDSAVKTVDVATAPTDKLQQPIAVSINTGDHIKPPQIIGIPPTSDVAFVQVQDGKPAKAIAPPAIISPLPPIMPLNNQNLIPNVALFMPVDTLCTQHMPSMPGLPLPLSLPVAPPPPAPIPLENVIQPAPIVHTIAAGPGAISLLPPSSAIPLITSVPTAHLPPGPSSIALPLGSFSIQAATEPLNLSSSSKKSQKQSQDLSFSNRQKGSGIPARRQTICGFEARNFVMFDEMEPLDLSKKPRPEKSSPSPVVSVLPKSIDMTPILLPAQQPQPLPLPQPTMGPIDTSSLLPPVPVPPLTPEALLNKPFYSNLDLLRIPQVRNPVAGQSTPTSTEPTPPPPPLPPIVPIVAAPPAPILTTKAVAKKRSKPCQMATTTAAAGAPAINFESVTPTTQTTITKTNNTKDLANIMPKRESSFKGKGVLRMDEEVINHIDDAINSVINAVKASIDSEEAEKSSQELNTPVVPILPKTTDDVNVTKESVGEFKYLTAARRNMRSKTLDCRPAALSKANLNATTLITDSNQPKESTVKPHHQTITVRNIETLTIPEANSIPLDCPNSLTPSTNVSDSFQHLEANREAEIDRVERNATTKLPEVTHMEIVPESSTTKSICENITSNLNQEPLVVDDNAIGSNTIIAAQAVKHNESPNIERDVTVLAESEAAQAATNTIPVTNTTLDLEQMSNNNNTSSGFHSSAQSDQQTSVMSATTTSVSTSMVVPDTKKKQRKRRKNELAAIVADQLLESFKLDKARRDNLKKLENLAYEKSEDLLLTGMLLMSSTKRNVSSSSAVNNSVAASTTTAADNTESTSKRSSNKSQQNMQASKANSTNSTNTTAITPSLTTTECPIVNNKYLDADKSVAENSDANDSKKNSKRRQCRRRGKTLDNENISKLKSSLESFSIDIERQLSEYEAKNVNVFKNVSGNDVGKSPSHSKTQTPANPKTTIILRPSILSMTLEASAHTENPQATKSLANNADAGKTVVSSRDPRLNKNIHKEGEKNPEKAAESKPVSAVVANVAQKHSRSPEEIGDLEEDNYLTEIAKNVNEKIMSTENEEFAFKDDGFEMANDMGMDDSNSKFSRPPTSMSVRSAPNFNDDRSNFGSICDENTNTEVMDMDLDDEMSVYTSYSQDLGRGRGRRRRRRRSILLTRKPKKRASSRDLSAEKIECILCKKVFYSANSLSKHNMTLAHVSKVSEQEYLLSKSLTQSVINVNQTQSTGPLGPYARRTATRRATISEAPMHLHSDILDDSNPLPLPTTSNLPATSTSTTQPTHLPPRQSPFKSFNSQEALEVSKREELPAAELVETAKSSNTPHLPKDVQDNDYDANNVGSVGGGGGVVNNASFNGNSRLNLNPDERLFFECCNILKSAETPRLNSVIVPEAPEDCNNISTNYNNYTFRPQDKSSSALNNSECIRDRSNVTNVNMDNTVRSGIHSLGHMVASNNAQPNNHQPLMEQSTLFRDPPSINTPNCYNRPVTENRNARSPTYSAISHLSAVTNTTSRFKTKAAMKGYDVNLDLIHQQESKSRTICKLTELAEIALGNEDKPNSHSFSPIQNSNTPTRPLVPAAPCTSKVDTAAMDVPLRMKGVVGADYPSLLVVDNPKESNIPLAPRNERTKNNETRSSTSSKTIMHSSIIKAAVEEHQKPANCNKIVIPDRPFKNIGLEEKETITFQKPKAPPVHLLTEDNNSVSTGSFSDRDDYDFGSLSCDEEASVRECNEKIPKNNSSESSSESSRATAKTFENKSLIMGRIFKNVSTKAAVKNNIAPAVKVKSVGVQKDQAPTPKADLNQLFDELRGNSGVEGNVSERIGNMSANDRGIMVVGSSRLNAKPHQRDITKHIAPAASPPAVVSSTTATPPTNTRKNKARESRPKAKSAGKTPKDISKLQTELGMSPDEIKKLIDEGQRKSKRRCATNRPKKLIEMWSSDEYEEFLSTKDIIALIEEKEEKEKRKKRKSSVNISSNNSEMGKEKDIPDVTSSTKDSKRRNTRKTNVTTERPVDEQQGSVERRPAKSKKANTTNKKENTVVTTSAVARGTVAGTKLPEKIDTVAENTKSKSVPSKATKSKGKQTEKAKAPVKPPSKEPKSKTKKSKLDDEDNNNDSADDIEDDYLISELKQKQAKKKTAASKARQSKAVGISAPTVTSTANLKVAKSSAVPSSSQSTRKRTPAVNVTATTADIVKAQKAQPKNKRKNQANQSPPRRKRPATEKLYYWSSSSDEEFGRINNNNNNKGNANVNVNTDNFETGNGEQYQKHGWIVGDSHKKLVTLLAIAKGNKKVDGVKKNITKKRS
ncbi:uncharacterized protein LOC106083919 [Stomoxys calcitrans]|uniref:uncharacterized protein LOC106083919 n=1 Tax=Stomoxys calcitrans TaxID=35570 RepID=UPI0027E2E1C2|nr:uncharacterized protein LOC106083919 [Stomoxys calcitrans]